MLDNMRITRKRYRHKTPFLRMTVLPTLPPGKSSGGITDGALALKHGVVPPTINLQNPDPECDLDYVPNTARELKVNAIINNSFGFGGHNASIAAKKFAG